MNSRHYLEERTSEQKETESRSERDEVDRTDRMRWLIGYREGARARGGRWAREPPSFLAWAAKL